MTPDEVPNRDDLELGCAIDQETVQKNWTSDMVFSVARLVAELSDRATEELGRRRMA